jgi:DNA-binding transcriptional MerR regulator
MSEHQYNIKDLEHFTQIKAHTIRIWEQRYGLLNPKRTETNIRYYNESDFKKILNIKLLYKKGYRISKIASFSETEIIEQAKSIIIDIDNDKEKEINDLIHLIFDFDRDGTLELLNNELDKIGLNDLYMNVILPLLEKLGQLWQVNSIKIVHEHFFSYVFREFIICQINELKNPPEDAKKAVLFLHDYEEHEFSILMYNYVLKKIGYKCSYFGQNVPITEMEEVNSKIQPEFIITTFTAKIDLKTFQKISSVLVRMAIMSKVIISGSQLDSFDPLSEENVHYIKTIDELESLIVQK